MNTFILPRRVVLLLSSLLLLGLSACATKKPFPPPDPGHPTHTITIKYDATASPQWDYKIEPVQSNPKKARVKRNDIVQWKCAQGTWKVYFKGPTPLLDRQTGKELPFVTAAAGVTAGGKVSPHAQIGEEFEYGVSVLLPGTTEPVRDDPRIIIEN